MNADEGNPAERVLVAMAAHLPRDSRLHAEAQRARREFFQLGPGSAGAPLAVPGVGAAAERRFLEWFLLEHDSAVLGAVPVEVPPFADLAVDLPESLAGVFVVQPITHGIVQARDLQDDTSFDLNVPAQALQGGDLLVGRLWDEGAGRWSPSTALAVIRPGAQLAIAFARDLQRLDLDRRLKQIELEHLLLLRPNATGSVVAGGAAPSVPLEHLEADLERLLQASGSDVAATDISQQLALAVRAGPVMGPLLDRLAFDTVVDLDRARALLLAIWNAHHADDPPAVVAEDGVADVDVGTAPGETLGERLVRTLDEGLAEKRDVAELFAQLERMAGIEPDPEDAEDLLGHAAAGDDVDDESDDRTTARPSASYAAGTDDDGDFDEDDDEAQGSDDGAKPLREPRPRQVHRDDDDDGADADTDAGDLGPLVEEYLWEQRRGDDPEAAPLRMFAELQRNTPLPHNDLEQVTTADVMRLLLHVYLGSAPRQRAANVRTAHEQVRGFFAWAVAEQEIPVGDVLAGCRGALLDQLDRLQAAGEGLSTTNGSKGRPAILQVEEIAKGGFGVSDDDGGNHWVECPAATVQHVRVGDLVLGALQPSAGGPEPRRFLGLVVVLPADAKALME